MDAIHFINDLAHGSSLLNDYRVESFDVQVLDVPFDVVLEEWRRHSESRAIQWLG